MAGYWTRHRLLLSVIMCVAVGLITSMLFVYPSISQKASYYNDQSVYKNSDIDFIAPEPSFEQTTDLPGSNGIDKVFPYFLTKTQVAVNGTSRTTTVLLSDQFQNIDITMYNQARLIEKADTEYENSILVDWQFCHDTSAKIGDTISFSIGGNESEYVIYAIYETNAIYDGGAILTKITEEQKEAIAEQSNNNGYSGMYISASDYNTCKSYLSSDYRPLGRLKDRNQFSDDEQYQIHYDAIMSSGYANEITDFRVRENSLDNETSSAMMLVGAIFALVVIIGFNLILARRGCEKVYFTKHCIPKGQAVTPYYTVAVVFETVMALLVFGVALVLRIRISDIYIPGSAIGIMVAVVPAAVILAEIISFMTNKAMVSEITRKVREELKKKEAKEADTQKLNSSSPEIKSESVSQEK